MTKIATSQVIAEVRGHVGCITLNRPQALNALDLGMVRSLTKTLLAWQSDASIHAVAIRGCNKSGPFGGFCAGGDIRFFHRAALSGDPALEDFFTEEYALNYLIHTYGKPYIAFMDGIVMGGGMGISQGASHRLVTANTKMAMPETQIGLFPDVGGGYFLSHCPGSTGEWLALTGEIVDGVTAVALGLADALLDVARLETMWNSLDTLDPLIDGALSQWIATFSIADRAYSMRARSLIDQVFSMGTVQEMVRALESSYDEWSIATAATLRKRSPLMLHVVLEQIRRARNMALAEDLRMERNLVRHCFTTTHLARTGILSETVEGIRALAIDKDHAPKWSPSCIEDVSPEMVLPFFASPWPVHAHPLRSLV
jgi:enoyl-CoA hydratase/carnithine racemase